MESSRSRSPHATEARAGPRSPVEEVRSAAVASSVAQEEAARVISDAPSDAPPAVEPAGQPAAAGSGSEPAARPVRLIGLDVARGLMLVVSVAVDAWITMPAWFAHAPWAGVHPIDLVFPTFVTLSGCGLAFAYGRRVPLGPTARRVVVLLLAGLAYNAFTQFAATGRVEWATFHLPGVLQFYAALVLAVALLHLVVRRWWMWPIWTVALALAYTWWLTSYAAGCPTGALTPECNPSRVLDPALFGVEHIYHQGRFGHDPEGAVALLGALVAVCGGASIGHVLRTSGLRGWRRIAVGLTVLATFVATALWTAQFVDPMKRLWTPPFSLGVAAACGLVLLVLHLLLDSARDSAPDSSPGLCARRLGRRPPRARRRELPARRPRTQQPPRLFRLPRAHARPAHLAARRPRLVERGLVVRPPPRRDRTVIRGARPVARARRRHRVDRTGVPAPLAAALPAAVGVSLSVLASVLGSRLRVGVGWAMMFRRGRAGGLAPGLPSGAPALRFGAPPARPSHARSARPPARPLSRWGPSGACCCRHLH